jgi:hypothetical protein
MNEQALKGRNWAIRIFASALLFSIHTIVTYNLVVESVGPNKILQQVVRFILTITLAYFVLKGKKWAILIATILFSVGALGGIFFLFNELPLISKIPMAVMTIIYSLLVYHINFSKSFEAYVLHQNKQT